MKQARPAVAVYVRGYLTTSMTFVHRQLSELDRFDAFGMCRFRQEGTRFPDPPGGLAEFPPLARGVERVLRRNRPVALGEHTLLERAYYHRVLAQRRPLLVHAHFADYALAVLPACEATGTPLMVTFHGYDGSKRLLESAFRDRYLELLDKATLVVGVSAKMRDRLIEFGAPADRTAAHYIGVTLPPPPDDDEREEGLVVQVARLVEKKGHHTTLEAFARAQATVPGLRLILAGDGPLRSELEREVERLHLTSAVVFAGDLPYADVERLLRRASIFVHPSVTTTAGDEEGIPTTVVEAMANGLPVIATHHAGIPELVEPGTGVLAREHDAVTVGDAMARLAKDPPSGREMGARARASVERRFDLTRNTALLQDAYELVGQRDGVGAAGLLNERLSG